MTKLLANFRFPNEAIIRSVDAFGSKKENPAGYEDLQAVINKFGICPKRDFTAKLRSLIAIDADSDEALFTEAMRRIGVNNPDWPSAAELQAAHFEVTDLGGDSQLAKLANIIVLVDDGGTPPTMFVDTRTLSMEERKCMVLVNGHAEEVTVFKVEHLYHFAGQHPSYFEYGVSAAGRRPFTIYSTLDAKYGAYRGISQTKHLLVRDSAEEAFEAAISKFWV